MARLALELLDRKTRQVARGKPLSQLKPPDRFPQPVKEKKKEPAAPHRRQKSATESLDESVRYTLSYQVVRAVPLHTESWVRRIFQVPSKKVWTYDIQLPIWL
jgi:hypothetical protein